MATLPIVPTRSRLTPALRTTLLRTLPLAAGTRPYTVLASDSMESLARRFRTTPAELATLNHNLSGTRGRSEPILLVKPGTVVQVPARGQAAKRFPSVSAANTITSADCGAGFVTHTFNAGTRSAYVGCISGSTASSCSLQGKPGVVSEYGVCLLPCGLGTRFNATTQKCEPVANTVPTKAYRITAGDTVKKIAARLGVTTTAIVALNARYGIKKNGRRLDLRVLPVGQFLRVPAGPLRTAPQYRGGLGVEPVDGTCPPGFTFDDGWVWDSCIFDAAGQACGNGGTYNDDGECVGESSGGGGSDGGDDGGAALANALSLPGMQQAWSAYQNGQDGTSWAAGQSASTLAAFGGCGVVSVLSALFGLGPFAAFVMAACAYKAASGNGDSDGNPNSGDTYPKECGTPGSGFYQFEAGGSCDFGGAGDYCLDANGTSGMYDTQGNCVMKTGGAPCLTPNGFQGTTDSTNACWVDACPAGKKANADESDCIDASLPVTTPPGTQPGTGPGKITPQPDKPKPGNKPPPTNLPAKTKAEDDNTVYWVAGAAAAAAAALALWKSRKNKKR